MEESQQILKDLAAPFIRTEDGRNYPAIKWKAGAASQNKKKVSCFPYIDARQACQRLNQVVGVNWKSINTKLTRNNNIMEATCELSILINGEWITRTDTGTAGKSALKGDRGEEIQTKGAVSDSIKRAAVQWGIGAYLYDIDPIWVDYNGKMPITKDGKPLYPKELNNYLNKLNTNLGLFYQIVTNRPEIKNDTAFNYMSKLFAGSPITKKK